MARAVVDLYWRVRPYAVVQPYSDMAISFLTTHQTVVPCIIQTYEIAIVKQGSITCQCPSLLHVMLFAYVAISVLADFPPHTSNSSHEFRSLQRQRQQRIEPTSNSSIRINMADAARGGARGGGFGARGDRGGDRGRGRGRRGPRRGANKNEEKEWQPVTKLGRLVKEGKIKSMEEIYLHSLPIKEYQIVDFFLPKLKDEVMKVWIPADPHKCD